MQAFCSLLISATLAGVVSPLVSDSVVKLSVTAGAITLCGFIAWRGFRMIERRQLLNS